MVNATTFCSDYEKNVISKWYGRASDTYRYVSLALLIVTCSYFIIGLILFLLYKNTNVRLQSRNIFMTILLIVAYVLMSLSVFIKEYSNRGRAQCGSYAFGLYLSFGFSGAAYVGNLARYMYKLRLQRDQGYQLIKQQQQKKNQQGDVENGESNPSNVQSNTSKKGLCYYLYDFVTMAKYSKNGRICIPGQEDVKDDHLSSNGSEGTDPLSLNLFLNDNQGEDFKWTLWDRIKEGIILQVIIACLFGCFIFLAGAVRIFTEPVFSYGCQACRLFEPDYIIFALNSALNVILILILMNCLRNEADPLGVISDGKIGLVCFIFTIPVCILQIYDPNNYYRDYKFTWDILFCFISCILFYPVIYGHLVKSYMERKRSKIKSKGTSLSNELSPRVVAETAGNNHTKYSSTNLPPASALDVDLIIQEPRARNALLEHMINELSSENLVFVFKVRAWKDIWSKDSVEKVNRIAINLYNEYISRSGKAQINISNTVYSKIEKTMSSNLDSSKQKSTIAITTQDKIPSTVFDECEAECLQIIKTDSLPRFRLSALFKERIIETGILDKVLNTMKT